MRLTTNLDNTAMDLSDIVRGIAKKVSTFDNFLFQSMNTMKRYRKQFEKHLIEIDMWQLEKQARSLIRIEVMARNTENQILKIQRLGQLYQRQKYTLPEKRQRQVQLQKAIELVRRGITSCELALGCLYIKSTDGKTLKQLMKKMNADRKLLGNSRDWLYVQEVLNDEKDVILNIKRMRKRVLRGKSFADGRCGHYKFTSSHHNVIERIIGSIRDKISIYFRR